MNLYISSEMLQWTVDIFLSPTRCQSTFPSPKLERLSFDNKIHPRLKVAHNLTLNINRIEGLSNLAFYRGKRHTTLLSCEWMGEAFSDKEVAFSLLPCNSEVGGEGCSFIKLSEWLNAILEHSESSHHHSMTGRREGRNEGRKQETEKMRDAGGINIEKEITEKESKIYFPTYPHD